MRIYNPKTGKNENIFELDNFLNPTSVIKNNSNSRLMKSTASSNKKNETVKKTLVIITRM